VNKAVGHICPATTAIPRHMGAPGRLVFCHPSNRPSLHFFGVGRRWWFFFFFWRSGPKSRIVFGNIFSSVETWGYLHHTCDYSSDVLAPLIGWRPGSSQAGPPRRLSLLIMRVKKWGTSDIFFFFNEALDDRQSSTRRGGGGRDRGENYVSESYTIVRALQSGNKGSLLV